MKNEGPKNVPALTSMLAWSSSPSASRSSLAFDLTHALYFYLALVIHVRPVCCVPFHCAVCLSVCLFLFGPAETCPPVSFLLGRVAVHPMFYMYPLSRSSGFRYPSYSFNVYTYYLLPASCASVSHGILVKPWILKKGRTSYTCFQTPGGTS
jgi:hypothetical protein